MKLVVSKFNTVHINEFIELKNYRKLLKMDEGKCEGFIK